MTTAPRRDRNPQTKRLAGIGLPRNGAMGLGADAWAQGLRLLKPSHCKRRAFATTRTPLPSQGAAPTENKTSYAVSRPMGSLMVGSTATRCRRARRGIQMREAWALARQYGRRPPHPNSDQQAIGGKLKRSAKPRGLKGRGSASIGEPVAATSSHALDGQLGLLPTAQACLYRYVWGDA
jgi:hypothetical protein